MDLEYVKPVGSDEQKNKLKVLVEVLPDHVVKAPDIDIYTRFDGDTVELIQMYQSAKEKSNIQFNAPLGATNVSKKKVGIDNNSVCEFRFGGVNYRLRDKFEVAF